MNRFPGHRAGRRTSVEQQPAGASDGVDRPSGAAVSDPYSALDVSVQDELRRGRIEGILLT